MSKKLPIRDCQRIRQLRAGWLGLQASSPHGALALGDAVELCVLDRQHVDAVELRVVRGRPPATDGHGLTRSRVLAGEVGRVCACDYETGDLDGLETFIEVDLGDLRLEYNDASEVACLVGDDVRRLHRPRAVVQRLPTDHTVRHPRRH